MGVIPLMSSVARNVTGRQAGDITIEMQNKKQPFTRVNLRREND